MLASVIASNDSSTNWISYNNVSVKIRVTSMQTWDNPKLIEHAPQAAQGRHLRLACGLYAITERWLALLQAAVHCLDE